MTLTIVADDNMPGLTGFETLGRVRRVDGRRLERAQLVDADILLVRSVTRVNETLLAGTPVRFVGSATIGTDHVDRDWLRARGIAFHHAPGCNAMAVAEYVLQALLRWSLEQGRAPAALCLGIVGCGNVGARVARLGLALGMEVRVCDPPRIEAGGAVPGTTASLDQALAADVVTLHVPLEEAGRYATRHLLDADRLRALSAGQLLINTCRGAVVDNAALAARLRGGGPAVVLDVWEGEPRIRTDLFARSWLGTPHIAGHSREGKLRGTAMLYRDCRHWLGLDAGEVGVRAPEAGHDGDVRTAEDLLALLLRRYDIRRDHRTLEDSLDDADPGAAFDRLRRDYPLRHECAGLTVRGTVSEPWRPLLSALGVLYRD